VAGYQIGDVTLDANVAGEGFPLLLIAGTGLPASIFGFHMGWLTEIRKVIAFDNRDVGASSDSPGEYTAKDMADDAAGLLDALGIEQADVIGYSLGGAIAQELAIAHPSRVRGLVLYSTWAATDEWLKLRFSLWERIIAATGNELTGELGAMDLFTHRFFVPGRIEMLRGQNAAAEPRSEGLMRQWRADQAHDARDRLAQIASPTLVVGAAEDSLVPARYSEELASLVAGAKLEILGAAAHGALIECPDAWRAAVEPFLQSLS
jgi:3-oxoadipate enol-lactonase